MKITIKRILCYFGHHEWNFGEWYGFPMTQDPTTCKHCHKAFEWPWVAPRRLEGDSYHLINK